jgi:hypothetical protein
MAESVNLEGRAVGGVATEHVVKSFRGQMVLDGPRSA